VVDGNVERVLSRIFALRGNPRTAVGKRRIWALAKEFADTERPGDTNQSLMELGAMVCTPATPKCARCPVHDACAARGEGAPERYPELAARRPARVERWTAVVAFDRSKTRVLLEPRTGERWRGMLVPPLHRASREDARVTDVTRALRSAKTCGSVRHLLTHATMDIEVVAGVVRTKNADGPSWVPIADLAHRAVPKVTVEILRVAGVTPPRAVR
jgi:A/G-specific adenine glycosylase